MVISDYFNSVSDFSPFIILVYPLTTVLAFFFFAVSLPMRKKQLRNIMAIKTCKLGLPPTQDSSHHQDYYIFSRESQPKPSFATGILGGG